MLACFETAVLSKQVCVFENGFQFHTRSAKENIFSKNSLFWIQSCIFLNHEFLEFSKRQFMTPNHQHFNYQKIFAVNESVRRIG